MTNLDPGGGHKRTAILAVHGIGSQRALETVRGVIRGVWLDPDNPQDNGKRLWSHPEKGVADIDLSVLTTNEVPGADGSRIIDFHELYWAHLMSETKAVAVLLWLYELCRKGPIMRTGLNGLWWAASIFLCLMNLSAALVVLKAVWMLAESSAQNLLVAPFLLLYACIVFGLVIAFRWSAFRLINLLAAICAAGLVMIGIYFGLEWLAPGGHGIPDGVEIATRVGLPTLVAMLATYLVMGQQGLRAFWRTMVLSVLVCICFLVTDPFWNPGKPLWLMLVETWPWSLNSPWGMPVAFGVLGIYLALNGAFLQPYLGDAARYFRGSPGNVAVRRAIRKEAVDALERLHNSGQYDRIVIVAHSLGCVVSYDMLRSYFSRVCDELPPVGALGPEFTEIDAAPWQPDITATNADRKALRAKARQVIGNIANATVKLPLAQRQHKSWLVTDFVTLGSALSHAYFLMCTGNSHAGLRTDFDRRVSEREFPTCPPKRLDGDGLLAFDNPKTQAKQVHNGALFGLTRWTNIYFPVFQIFWGDAIGGALGPIFGRHIVDVPVSTTKKGGADFFTHTAYWDVERKPDEWNAPHIAALRDAVDLADRVSAIDIVDRGIEAPDG
jgi:hypothetical protein